MNVLIASKTILFFGLGLVGGPAVCPDSPHNNPFATYYSILIHSSISIFQMPLPSTRFVSLISTHFYLLLTTFLIDDAGFSLVIRDPFFSFLAENHGRSSPYSILLILE